MKKYILSCIIGILLGGGLIFAYDDTIESQSQEILQKIKQNASNFTEDQALIYYKLEQKEIERLIQVLVRVKEELKYSIDASPENTSNPNLPSQDSNQNNSSSGVSNTIGSGNTLLKECYIKMDDLSNRFGKKSLTTTFYRDDITGKIYQPDASGNMRIPTMNASVNISLFEKGKGPDTPSLWINCDSNTILHIYDEEFKKLGDIPYGSLGNGKFETIINPSIQSFDIICAGNGWSPSIKVTGENIDTLDMYYTVSGSDKKLSDILITRNGEDNSMVAQLPTNTLSIAFIKRNTGITFMEKNISQCITNIYPPKPKIVSAILNLNTKILKIQVENALESDYIDIWDGTSNGGCFTKKQGNIWTCDLSDPFYGKLIDFIKSGESKIAIYGSFSPNYWRNSVRNTTYPITITDNDSSEKSFSLSRTCNGTPCTTIKPGDRHGANWTTKGVKALSVICSGPSDSPHNNHFDQLQLNMSNNFASYDDLVRNGWVPGVYNCKWSYTGDDNSDNYFYETFNIQ